MFEKDMKLLKGWEGIFECKCAAQKIQRVSWSAGVITALHSTLPCAAAYFTVVAEPPAVYTGPAAIHGLLLQQLRLIAWYLAYFL
jgi:hypothetical protein